MHKTDDSRPLRKSYTLAPPSQTDPFAEGREALKNAMILMPKVGPAALAEALINNSYDFQPSLNDLLARAFYIAAYHAERRKQAAANRAQWALPGFEHMPQRVPGPKGKMLLLLDANATAVRAYYRRLIVTADAKTRNSPRIKEAKALMDKMSEHSRTEERITVRQVLLMEQQGE